MPRLASSIQEAVSARSNQAERIGSLYDATQSKYSLREISEGTPSDTVIHPIFLEQPVELPSALADLARRFCLIPSAN
jgi:hypothetical protein